MPTKLWHRASMAALLAPIMLLAACSGPSDGGGSSPPPTASIESPAPSLLPSAPASPPPTSQPPSIAEQFIQRVSLPNKQTPAFPEEQNLILLAK